ncbi:MULTISPECIES: hypothetical protein [unclassified Streptomyces]|uniref:hypothetical protein n=1 Tax=unclassified Streptomyces TaxID=2593676 RepID=UPI001661DADE|nr:hypothetical protein [Streptomyces sp. CBMA29]MBD0734239.1 hypothetical protein [Streptomyces sp. CBMA29]
MSRSKRMGTIAVLSGGALFAGLTLAPHAVAVTPATATASYNCGTWGSGTATLTATDSGGVKKLKLSSSTITVPAGTTVPPNSITTTIKVKQNGSTEVDFSGTVNPAMTGAVTLGPLPQSTGTLAAGDKTDSWVLSGTPSATNWSVKIVTTSPSVTTVYCIATSAQSTAFTW